MVGAADPQVAREAVDRMTTALERRGPDSGGSECWPQAVLGHRRLSIFDLSAAGHQPMLSDDRAVGVAFNGAVYNFRALRAELEGQGHHFRSQTDTEVLVRGYAAWGIDALVARLRGMFAFALWDERRGRLFLVRDRLGVKRLLYAVRGGALAFASTARALHAAGFGGELDELAVAEFLEYGFVTDERSIYGGVRKVPAASIVEWADGASSTRTYWTPPAAASSIAASFDEVVDETERLLLQAVERRLQADVPVGALLSGGIDSGLVCWAIKALGGDVTAFTVGTAGDASDESDEAAATARELGLRHTVLQLEGTQPTDVHDLVAAYAEPFACASALGMLRISHAVSRSNVKVLLTGDGGDDVFLGYERHRFLQVAQRIARGTPAGVATAWRGLRRVLPMVGPVRRAAHFADYATGGMGAFLTAREGFPGMRARGLLGERLRDARLAQREIPWSIESARHILDEYLEHDRRTQFVAEYMTKVDGSTMYYALEARSPFLDQDLWEYAAGLPIDLRLRGGELKAVLRALARRRIGARVATGRKRGFTIPVERWMA
ncbi:MAG TPA: asparagine synthase (glutamine-hydrolyzing), partial [Gemmatimonadaceae bacterium]|nr:asparagine synthase (glutamine-hydrolyzing) [Gemmatimonadaceae bacterium]